MLANREEPADGHRERKTRTRWIMGLCLAYQLADRGGRRVPVVQQNPVAIRKKALQYSAASHISSRTATTRDRLSEPERFTPNRLPHIQGRRVYADKSTLSGC